MLPVFFFPCGFSMLVMLAVLIFIEHGQIMKFNQKLHSVGPGFIRLDLPNEITEKLRQQTFGPLSMEHGEWFRVDRSTFLFYWSGSEKRIPSMIPLRGKVILQDGSSYAEGRLNLSSLAFFIATFIFISVWVAIELSLPNSSGINMFSILGAILAPLGFILISIPMERANFKEVLRDLGSIG